MDDLDNTDGTLKHMKRVAELLNYAAGELIRRANFHDATKLQDPEKPFFDRLAKGLEDVTFGSEEYYRSLKELEPALRHHYAANDHHPEHYPNGVGGMSLFGLVEMFFDWKASSEGNDNGNIYHSIDVCAERYNLPEQLVNILKNTAKNMGWEK
jgi:hypothetical protein